MASFNLDQLTVQGIRDEFYEAMGAVPQIWQPYCRNVPATTEINKFAFPGTIPQPRVLLNGRHMQGVNQFTYNITTQDYEMSYLIPAKQLEDNQTGFDMTFVREIGAAYGAYKNLLFATMLKNAGTTLAFDGTAFFADTRVIGASANVDNNFTSNITDPQNITSTEFLVAIKEAYRTMSAYEDDNGRPYNGQAISDFRVLAHSFHTPGIMEALNATFISQTDNVFRGWANVDLTPYLKGAESSAVGDTIFFAFLGGDQKPCVYSQRMEMKMVIHDDEKSYEHNLGLLVETRERFVFALGDPRRMSRHVLT